MRKAPVIISLGGSLIAPAAGIDLAFLAKFRKLLARQVAEGGRFVVVCGGGAPARRYQEAARALGRVADSDLDWLGIRATRLNAELVRVMLGRLAHPTVVTDPTAPPKSREPVLVAAGWKPGWSTDYDAALLASKLGARTVINLSDVDYVYSADPKTHPEARPLSAVSWQDFRRIVGRKWIPGAKAPFDPIAASLGEKLALTVKMVRGRSLKDVAAAISGKPFRGTTIG